ncbi:MAG: GNAT family N-acetyltransferase [Oscillospiraceae bacterium]|nr:GNAT family N-acetyltransferase [Oscillospiraceae bacterium]
MEIIRAATTAERAGAYYVRIQAMAVKHHISLYQEFDEHDTPETRYIVITDDVLPVATGRLYPIDDTSMMLGRIVVLPEYRRQGLGSRVIREAESWAAQLGFRRIVLESRENKVGFYQKLGYVPDFSRVIRGDTFTCIHMEKTL